MSSDAPDSPRSEVVRVLLVDDNTAFLEALSLLLEQRWTILTAESAQRAKEVLKAQEVALIVADDRMPGESGVDLLAWAYRHHPSAIRILLTGYTDADKIVRSINEGHIWHYVRKPCNNDELINLIERALEFRGSQLAMRRSERRYRELFHHAHVGIARLDERGRILEANQSLAASLGYDEVEDLLDRDLPSFCQDPDQWEHLRERLSRERAVDSTELVLRHRTSHPVFVLVNATHRVTELGERVIEASILDFTQRRLAVEENVALKAQLRRVQRHETVGSLACGIAHDFNNQMTVVLSSASFAATLVEDQDSIMSECLADIIAASRYASDLSRQLMTFVRQDDLGPEPVDVNTTLELTVRLLTRTLISDIRVERSLSPNLPPVRGDRAQLHQCFLNLCLNACQAMEQGGELRLESALVEGPDLEGIPRRWVEVRLSDTGVGMSDEVKAHIFEPFYTTKVQGKGTGLGLSMVQATVKQSGGTIQVESTPGSGSCFTLRFPAHEETVRGERPSGSVLKRSEGGLVLLADDDPAIRKATGRTLEQMGFTALRASNGKEATQLIEQHPDVRLALLDAVMPVMDGEEAFRFIRELRPTLPVLFTTGYIVTAQLQRALEQDRVSILHKPFDAADLERELRSLLREKRGG